MGRAHSFDFFGPLPSPQSPAQASEKQVKYFCEAMNEGPNDFPEGLSRSNTCVPVLPLPMVSVMNYEVPDENADGEKDIYYAVREGKQQCRPYDSFPAGWALWPTVLRFL